MNSNRRDRSRGSRGRESKSEKVDLRSKISTMRRKRERSVSPLHSIVHKVIDNKIRRLGSKSPPRRNSSDSKNDDRKSYSKYMNDRSDFLKKLEEEEESGHRRRSRTREERRKSRKEEKRNKKSKKSHRSDRKERKRSRERSKRRSSSRDKTRTYKEREKSESRSPEQDQVNTDDGHQEPSQSEQTEEQKENNDVNIEEGTTKIVTEVKEDTKIDDKKEEEDEDDFDDFNEAELSSLTSSSLSLSSVEEVPERIISPLDGWKNNGFHQNSRLSGSPPIPPREHSQSRSRSRSRPYDHPKSKSRSISPPAFLPTTTWESRVSEFVRSIGGVPNRCPSSTLLESIPSTSNQQPAVLNYPPPPVISYVQLPAAVNVPPPFLVGPLPEAVNLALPPPALSTLQMGTVIKQSSGSIPNGYFHKSSEIPVKANQVPHPKTTPPSPDQEEPQPEEITLTPLIKFIGQKLADKKLTNLMSLRKGFFRYNLLSVASRGEWVASRVLAALEQVGLTENKMYNMAALKGRQGFHEYLKNSISDLKVNFGPNLTNQDLKLINCVIELIVQYFTFDGTTHIDEKSFNFDEEDENVNKEHNSTEIDDNSTPSRAKSSLAEIVKKLAAVSKVAESVERKSPVEEDNTSDHPPVNPWSNMWNWMQSENFKTFLDLKMNLAKGFMRSGGKFSKNSFEAAGDMVSCWVIAGFSLHTIKPMVMSAEEGRILPPPNYSASEHGKYLFHELLEQLKAYRLNMPPHLTDEDLELLVRKTLIYVARGCDRMSALSSNPALSKLSHKNKTGSAAPSYNYVYNYLPPGLRELENSVKSSNETSNTQTADDDDDDKMEYLSSDPLNRIIDPVAGSHRPGELPNRKYLIGSVHLDWVVINGRPEIFEISVYVTDMTSLDLYIVTDGLQKHLDTLEHLNFVSNPDRHEFYYVQVGIGCVRAEWKQKGMDKLAEFLEAKRNSSTSENQNNGLVLLFRGEEELSVLLSAWQATGHNDLMLDTVKGFGCLESYIEQHKSTKFEYTTPKLNVGGSEGFFTAEVKRGLEITNFISKSKGQALYQAYEILLQQSPNYQNFIQPHCFPSFSPQVTSLMQKLKQIEEMYSIEVFIAASLKSEMNVAQSIFLEGVYAPARHRDLRDKCSIVASRFCNALVQSGFDKASLAKRFKRDPGFAINSSVILDKMNVAQRMSVTDQTMRCILFLKEYFKMLKTN